jgi:aryl-alcohol dehydrogenase-like predicted oxidoreductase
LSLSDCAALDDIVMSRKRPILRRSRIGIGHRATTISNHGNKSDMEFRQLGRSGIKVSTLTLGTMMFGGPTDEATAARIIDKAHEQGVNSIDTADVYAGSESERVVGRCIARQRERWVLATKFASQLGNGDVNAGGASRKYVARAVEASLKRLNTDYIDLLYIHAEDHDTPVDETVRALNDLIQAGKLRYYGLSNHRAWKIAEFAHTAQALGLDAPVASQPLYNIANRQAEAEQLTAAHRYGLGVISYSPLARGVLTGKYETGVTPASDTRAGRGDRRLQQAEWRPESLELARRIREHAQARGLSAGQFALAWVLNSRYISSTIAGPRTEAQWDDYLPALGYRLSAEDEAFVDSLVATGHPSTPGFNDPKHLFFGRIARHGSQQA